MLVLSAVVVGNAAESRKPAIYFDDFGCGADYYNRTVIQELLDAGFEVSKNHGQGIAATWTLDCDTLSLNVWS